MFKIKVWQKDEEKAFTFAEGFSTFEEAWAMANRLAETGFNVTIWEEN